MSERGSTSSNKPAGLTPVPPRRGPGGPGGPGGRFGRPVEKPKNAWGALRRLGVYLSAEKYALLAVFLLVAAGAALATAGPYLQGRVIDEFILKGDVQGLLRTALLMLGVYGAGAVTH